MWKDASGAMRVAWVAAQRVDQQRITIACDEPLALPMYRLVHFQLERAGTVGETWPAAWRDRRLLSAVWQVGPCHPRTGTPGGYDLRVLDEPEADTLARAS